MKLIQILFCIYIFMKQFYIFSSGGLQVADIIFIISFILYFMQAIKTNKLILNNIDKIFLMFLFLLIIVNLTYSTIYERYDFIPSCMFYMYNFMVILLFRQLIKEDLFLYKFMKTLKLVLVTQTIIYILGIGRWFGGTRYMGTFNDPNQMGFFVLISFLAIVVLNDLLENRNIILYYVISIFLIVQTSSTGMLLGIASFTIIYLLIKNNKIINKLEFKLKYLLQFIFGAIIATMIIVPNMDIIKSKVQSLPILERIEEKFYKASSESKSSDNNTLIMDRNIDRLLQYPQYMIIGAGEGYHSRFDSYHPGEIHSTLLSILFYYGIIAFLLIISWILKNIRFVPKHIYSVYIALIIESFTLLNQRQSMFWIIFILGSLYQNSYNKKHNFS